MPATMTQLTGGKFQDSAGNILANGYLMFRLNQDSSVSGVGNVAAGIEIKILLNPSGSVVSSPSQSLWANDVLAPVNSYYTVTGYTTSGQPAWGPNNQQITSGGTGGGTFDLGTWIPNQVYSWTPPLQPLVVEVNGVAFSSPELLDVVNSSTVTWVDVGGGVLKATASVLNTSGQNLIPGLQWNQFLFGGVGGQLSSQNVSGYAIAEYVPGTVIAGSASSSKIQICVDTALSAAIQEFVIIRTLKNSLLTVDITPVSFGGSFTPTFGSGYQTSDPISLVIDALHDYYVCATWNIYGGTGSIWVNAPANNYVVAGNPNIGGYSPPSNLCSYVWATSIGAGGGWGAAFPVGIGSPPVNFISSWVVT